MQALRSVQWTAGCAAATSGIARGPSCLGKRHRHVDGRFHRGRLLPDRSPAAGHVHVVRAGFGKFERHELRRLPTARGLAVTSTNPGFLDINLISPGNDFRRASVDAVLGALELAHDLEAGMVIVMPGRRHALSPAPDDACRWRPDQALEILLERAAALGVTIAARSTSSVRPGPSAPSASTASPSTSSSTSNRRCRACTTTSPRSGSSGGPFRRPARSRASRRPERRRVTSPTEPRR